jgi:two-component system sensor histidine kinase PilS (NtrC family)
VTILAERPLSDASATGLVWVFDDGPGVPEDKQANLFEPFFTTEGRGTGLGLYMAREFCVLNRAELAYAVRRGIDKERRGFRITFGDATQHQEQATSPLPSQEHR